MQDSHFYYSFKLTSVNWNDLEDLNRDLVLSRKGITTSSLLVERKRYRKTKLQYFGLSHNGKIHAT